jgi:hypothetical protein
MERDLAKSKRGAVLESGASFYTIIVILPLPVGGS